MYIFKKYVANTLHTQFTQYNCTEEIFKTN